VFRLTGDINDDVSTLKGRSFGLFTNRINNLELVIANKNNKDHKVINYKLKINSVYDIIVEVD
jgi:hypothetical protein